MVIMFKIVSQYQKLISHGDQKTVGFHTASTKRKRLSTRNSVSSKTNIQKYKNYVPSLTENSSTADMLYKK